MLFKHAYKAMQQVFSPALRGILFKSLALTLALIALIGIALTRFIGAFITDHHVSTGYAFADMAAFLLAGFGLFILLIYLLPALSILVAGYFGDDIAENVEKADFPNDQPGQAQPLSTSMLGALRFAGLALIVNLAALILFFIPIINVVAFFAANSYLLGREYFELAASRFRSLPEAVQMRRHYSVRVWCAGALIAGLLLIPILNLLTPLFGIALMVHLNKVLTQQESFRAGSQEHGMSGHQIAHGGETARDKREQSPL
jgi:CysZ protein